ncbi:MAG TPA: O-antigen ligase family protein [Candidatus Saccharimonadales bacterium]|nr:O-antigen ligase family protein [Candidatus Saccharimonadales bacterium]
MRKALNILLFLAVLTFPLGEIFRIDLGQNIAIRPQDVIAVIIFVFYLILILRNKQVNNKYLLRPLIIFSSICFLSLVLNSSSLTNIQFFVALSYLIRWISYSSIALVINGVNKKTKKIYLFTLFIVGLIILALGYVQYFLYPNLRNLYYLGWDEHNYRMFSVLLDPNFAGAIFVLFFLFLSGTIIFNLIKNQIKNAIVFGIFSACTLLAIFLTYSRSAILMLIAGSITFLVLIGKKKYLLILSGIFIAIIILLSPTFNKENTNLFRTASSFARVETYTNSGKIIEDHPIFGIGFNAYRYAQESYGFRKIQTRYPSHADAGVDNSFLFVLATTGLVGFITYLFLWYTILKRAFDQYRIKKSYISLVVISSSVGLFVDSFFINSLFFPTIMLWMWLLIGLVEDF